MQNIVCIAVETDGQNTIGYCYSSINFITSALNGRLSPNVAMKLANVM